MPVGFDTRVSSWGRVSAALGDQRGDSGNGRTAADIGNKTSTQIAIADVGDISGVFAAEVLRKRNLEVLLTTGVGNHSLEGTHQEVRSCGSCISFVRRISRRFLGHMNIVLTGGVNESKSDDRTLLIFQRQHIGLYSVQCWERNRRHRGCEDQRIWQSDDADVVQSVCSVVVRMRYSRNCSNHTELNENVASNSNVPLYESAQINQLITL